MASRIIIFIYLGVISISAYEVNNEIDFVKKEKSAMKQFTDFCLDKPKRDFCSEANLESMLRVLQIERIKNIRIADEVKKQKLQILAANSRQLKLEKFFAKNPQYKFMSEFGSSRFY
jgi:hypothetical protein